MENAGQPGGDQAFGVRIEALKITLTAYYALQAPASSSSEPPALLMALHGWGQNCRHFMRNFRSLDKRNIMVVAPQAPHQFYLDAETRKVGFNWLTRYERDQSIADLNQYLFGMLEVIQRQEVFDPRRIFVLGFSQGASVAYRFAASGLVYPAGVIACCADLPADVAERLNEVGRFPVLLAQGRGDDLVPEAKVIAARKAFLDAGFVYEDFVYDGGHRITPELVEAVGEWVDSRCGRSE